MKIWWIRHENLVNFPWINSQDFSGFLFSSVFLWLVIGKLLLAAALWLSSLHLTTKLYYKQASLCCRHFKPSLDQQYQYMICGPAAPQAINKPDDLKSRTMYQLWFTSSPSYLQTTHWYGQRKFFTISSVSKTFRKINLKSKYINILKLKVSPIPVLTPPNRAISSTKQTG